MSSAEIAKKVVQNLMLFLCTKFTSIWPFEIFGGICKSTPPTSDLREALQCTTISSADIRRDLHWLPINHRISYKLSLLTWKALYTAELSYLSELISPYVPARTLRSSNTYLLSIPTAVTSHFSSRSFYVSAPLTWNSLPQHIRSIGRLLTFKRQLKSHFFQSAFTV